MSCSEWFFTGLFGHFAFDLVFIAAGALGLSFVQRLQRFRCKH